MSTEHYRVADHIHNRIRYVRSEYASVISDDADSYADGAELHAYTLRGLHDYTFDRDYDLIRGQRDYSARMLYSALAEWIERTNPALIGTELIYHLDHLAGLVASAWDVGPATVTTVDTVQPLSLFGSTDGQLFTPDN